MHSKQTRRKISRSVLQSHKRAIEELLVSREEAAKRLQVDAARVTQMFDAGILDGIRVPEGKRYHLLITVYSIEKRLANPVKRGRPTTKE